MAGKKDEYDLRCTFCGKTQKEVKKLIAGPTAYICNECVSICNEIIADDEAAKLTLAPQGSAHVGMLTCPFCRSAFTVHTQFNPASQPNTQGDDAE